MWLRIKQEDKIRLINTNRVTEIVYHDQKGMATIKMDNKDNITINRVNEHWIKEIYKLLQGKGE